MHSNLSSPSLASTTTATLYYPVTVIDKSELGGSALFNAVTQNIEDLCKVATETTSCQILYASDPLSLSDARQPLVAGSHSAYEFVFSITLSGLPQQVAGARSLLLRSNPSQACIYITINTALITAPNNDIKPTVKRWLDETTVAFGICIDLVPIQNPAFPGPSDRLYVELFGKRDQVELARLHCLVYFDRLLGLDVAELDVDPVHQPILSGKQRINLTTIMSETLTNIYVPSPMPSIISLGHPALSQFSRIIITGDRQGVELAKAKLAQLRDSMLPRIKTRQIPGLHRKIDWMWMNRREGVLKIIKDNATFVRFPLLESNETDIFVFGEDDVYIDRAVRALMLLACELYVALIQIGPMAPPKITPSPPKTNSPSPSALIPGFHILGSIIGGICRRSRAEIIFQKNFVQIYGEGSSMKEAFKRVIALDFMEDIVRDIKFQLELALEHREFINGKKNGKINKIIRSSGCRISFQEMGPVNMFIDICNSRPEQALEALALVEDELPAEISFHVNESHHKRIIGVGGKNIQRIMKKHGVYVKFSNAEEYARTGGYAENIDNVIARTPTKNKANLELLKASIMELVVPRDQADECKSVAVPRDFHRMLCGLRVAHIRELEQSYKVQTVFPERESGQDDVQLKGPSSHIQQAAQVLWNLVPQMTSVHIPMSKAVREHIKTPEFKDTVMRLRQEFSTDLSVYLPPDEAMADGIFNLFYPRTQSPGKIEEAKALLKDAAFRASFSAQPGASRIPTVAPSFGGSGSPASMSPFNHFNSKLITPIIGGHTIGDYGSPPALGDYAPFGNSAAFINSRRPPLRFAHSTPDLKSIFDINQASVHERTPSTSEVLADPQSFLSSTLMATSISSMSGPDWGSRGTASLPRHNPTSAFAHTSVIGVPLPRVSLSDAANAPIFTSNSSIPEGALDSPQLKVPTSLNRGKALSRSMPFTSMEQERVIHRPPGLRDPSVFNPIDLESLYQQQLSADELHRQLEGLGQPNEPDYAAVEGLLKDIGLDRYYGLLRDADVDIHMLMTLKDPDLRDLGISDLAARRRLLSAIGDCKEPDAFKGGRKSPPSPSSPSPDSSSRFLGSSSLGVPGYSIQPTPGSDRGSGGQGHGRGSAQHQPQSQQRQAPQPIQQRTQSHPPIYQGSEELVKSLLGPLPGLVSSQDVKPKAHDCATTGALFQDSFTHHLKSTIDTSFEMSEGRNAEMARS
ncbi:uncharacterized protein BJ171DRAFT_444773 [Polychytrium aggregatum]|uniref:uncharacterized protein n=1 Tax=Polychytrium aggregatum TaxID=110093 RepID=UPI0022FE14A1|nr:uncharacterized protein BJ171DRAFT_444773 [Polychytrium aggregatum]KAI9202045.1 hypothetical protein BJ171DRAFT_444773 [Polychytrium aggregatum]